MAALGLDATYGAYLDHIPGVTLATVNLMSLLGLHRRWRGAIVGHLALFEMTSSVPNRRYARRAAPARRSATTAATSSTSTSRPTPSTRSIAAVDLAGGLARQEPELTPDILWGARALVELEAPLGHAACSRRGRRAAPRCSPRSLGASQAACCLAGG